MTIVAEAPATGETGFRCKGKIHTPTNTSWREGCRHPGAIEAHKAWLDRFGDRDRMRPPAVDAGGNCIAEKHNSLRAYRAGCRCPSTVHLWNSGRNVKRKLDPDLLKRSVDYSSEWDREVAKVKRMTGGLLRKDPRRPWRGGMMAVSRNGLVLLLSGFTRGATRGERLAAAIRLQGTLTRSAWCDPLRPIFQSEIAERIGCTDQTAGRLIKEVWPQLIENRHLRRLADVQWKAAVAQAAPVREAAARAAHEGPTRAQRRGAAWKAHCRTMRRLRESQERVKLVALAIERRKP